MGSYVSAAAQWGPVWKQKGRATSLAKPKHRRTSGGAQGRPRALPLVLLAALAEQPALVNGKIGVAIKAAHLCRACRADTGRHTG